MTLGITSYNPLTPLSRSAPALSSTVDTMKSNTGSATTELMKFLQMSPQEKMEAQWLSSHGLTKEELSEKSPEEQAAIQKQMADELKREVEQKGSKPGSYLDVMA